MNAQQGWGTAASLLLATTIMLGAFGAHGLKALLTPEQLTIYQTAVTYQAWHALGLLLLSTQMAIKPRLNVSAWIMSFGILVFSGSLYALVLSDIGWLGAITPLGGTAFIVAWIHAAWTFSRS